MQIKLVFNLKEIFFLQKYFFYQNKRFQKVTYTKEDFNNH